MAFARETLESQGGFSADYGMKGEALGLGEETELFQRLFDAGACFWYDPEIEVKHWVPQRNMQIGYRLKRAFRAGTTCARLGRSQFMSATYLKCVWSLALTLVRAPKTILSARDGIVTGSVLWLQDVGYCLGYLAGQSRLP